MLTTDASVAPNSGVARTVFASSTNPKTTILVTVSEIDSLGGTTVPGGLTGSVLLNADGTNPNVASLTAASISVSNPNISNPNISNPNISNPNISNPNISNPNISNVDVTNPNISNPNISNPNISNPNISNPNISNPNISNTAPTDATWSITNTGGTTTSASLKLFLNNNVPGGAAFQAVVYKAQSNPTITVTNTNDCLLGTESTIVPFVNITSSPDVFAAPQQLFLQPAQDPELSHMSVQVNPGETVYLTLRVYGTGGFDVGQFVNNSVTLGAVAQPDPPAKAVFSGPPVIATATLPDGTASTSYGPVPLSVFAGTAPLIWTASGLPPGVTIDSSTGVLQGSPTNLYTATYNPTITVTDSAVSPRSSSKTFQMTVLVPLAITTATLTDAGVGAAYSQPLAASGGIGSYSWSSTGMLPPGLDLSIGGVLSGNPTTADTYTIHAKVANSSAPMQTPATATLTLKVWPPIQIGTASLPDTGVNLSYNQSLVASGGTGSYSWTVTDGKLPDGLLLSTAGVLGGTPTTVGAYTFTVQATNASGPAQTGKQQYTVNVYAPIQVSGIALPPAGVGTFYTQTLSANGGHGPYTWSAAGSLPPGVSLSTQGVLSGTPTGAGNYAFSVTAANASGLAQSSSAPFSVTVYPVIHITTSALPATIIGSPYLVTLSANGGAGSYTWAVTGSLPPTLSLSPGGVLSGSVTAPGSFTFGVTASNASGPAQSASSQYTIYATAPLSFTAPSTTLPPATAGTPYSFTFVLNGVTGPVTWSSTTLPTGLTLSPAGTLSGTPAVSGAYQFDVTATDQFPQTVKQTFSINIAPMSSPTLVTTCVPGGTTATASSRTSAGDPNSAIDCVIANVPSQSAWNAGQHTGSLTLTLPSAMTLMGVTIDSNSTPAGQQSYAIYLDGSLTPIEPASTVFIPDTQCGSNQILFPAPITAKTVRVVTTNTNSWVSVCEVRLVATAGFTSAYQMQNWTPSASNGGTMTLSPSTGRSAFASFTYNVNTGAKNGVSDRNWSFQAPAAASGTVTFKYRYTGNHANANVTAYLKVSAGTSVTTLYNGSGNCGNTCTAPAGGFDVQGTGSITVTKGQIVKFTVGGSNKDGTLPALQGRVTITDLSAPQ